MFIDYYGNLYRQIVDTSYDIDKILNLNNELRRLWQEHILWTRFTVLALINNTSDLELVTKRLLQNPSDFEKLLSDFYDISTSREFERLLREHLTIATDVVKAAASKNTDEFNRLNEMWHKNADEIAALMNKMNPYWEYEMVRNMMYDHLNLLLSEITAIINGDIQSSIDFYNATEMQAYAMADVFRDGIISQFNDRFVFN